MLLRSPFLRETRTLEYAMHTKELEIVIDK